MLKEKEKIQRGVLRGVNDIMGLYYVILSYCRFPSELELGTDGSIESTTSYHEYPNGNGMVQYWVKTVTMYNSEGLNDVAYCFHVKGMGMNPIPSGCYGNQ